MKMQFLACVCVSLRLCACLRAALIKMQNAFARKIFQHSNALWVQKLSGCTIYKKSWDAAAKKNRYKRSRDK